MTLRRPSLSPLPITVPLTIVYDAREKTFQESHGEILLNRIIFFVLTIALTSGAQQARPPKPEVQKTTPAHPATPPKTEQPPQEATQNAQEEGRSPRTAVTGEEGKERSGEQHFDMTESPPVVTHHQISVNGR